jgi:hypothetical protein
MTRRLSNEPRPGPDCINNPEETNLIDPHETLDAVTDDYLLANELSEAGWAGFLAFLPSLKMRSLFEWRGLGVTDVGQGRLLVQCPWEEDHREGDDKAIITLGVPERDWLPIFHCFNARCVGRSLLDVLEFFGPPAVCTFCLEPDLELEDGSCG